MLTIVWSAGLPSARPTVGSSGKSVLTAETDFGSDIGARGSIFSEASIRYDQMHAADGSQRRQPRDGSASMSLDPSASVTTSSTRPVTLADAEASDEQAEFAEQGELVNLDEAFNLPYLDDVYGNYSLPFHDEIWTGSNHDIAEKKAEKARRKAAHDAKKAANDAAKEAADEAAGRSTAPPTSAPKSWTSRSLLLL